MKTLSPWTWLILLSAAAAGVVTLVNGNSQMHLVIILWFLLVCPGMMLVRFFRLNDPALEWMLAIALSMAADTFVAGALLYSGKWSPSVAFAALLALTAGGVIVQGLGALREQRRKLV